MTAPERTCIGCRIAKPQTELLRLVRDDPGRVTLDVSGRMSGRGAYLCRSSATHCLEEAHRRRAIARALRMDTAVVDYTDLGSQLRAVTMEESP